MSNWIEVSVVVDGEGAEAIADVLSSYAYQGVSIEQVFPGEAWEAPPYPSGPLQVRAYIPENEQAPTIQRKIEEAFYYLRLLYDRIPQPVFTTVTDSDWAEAWKRHYRPIRVGKHIVIKPAWVHVVTNPGDVVIEMDPGMAFGTGTHPTTQLCLQACEWFIGRHTRVIDIGTGSGILAIAAAKLGSPFVYGLDLDEIAVRAARENVALNQVADRVEVALGSLGNITIPEPPFDLGLANLTARIILEMAPSGFEKLVRPGGKLVFSGLIRPQMDEVVETLSLYRLQLMKYHQMEDWVMLIMERQL